MVPPATTNFNAPADGSLLKEVLPYGDELKQLDAAHQDTFAVDAAPHQHGVRGMAGRDRAARRALLAADLVAAVATVAATVMISDGVAEWADLTAILLVAPICMMLGLYERDADLLNKTTFEEIPRLLCGSLLVAVISLTARNALLGHQSTIAVDQLAFISFSMFAAMCVLRISGRRIVRERASAERIMTIGSDVDNDRLSHALAATPGLKAIIASHLSTDEQLGVHGLPMPIDEPDKLQMTLSVLDIDRVVIGTDGSDPDQLGLLIRRISETGTKVSVQPQLFGSTRFTPLIEDVGAVKLVNLRQPRLSPAQKKLKRVLDVCGSLLLLALASPILLVVAIAIKLDSRGPVYYRQKRIGLGGEPFEIFKFRTMVQNADREKQSLLHMNETSGLFKLSDDPRVTRVGRFLRKTSIDELPQLWNVVRGDMSLVGPRPLVPEEDRKITGWGRHRSTITPGMTGVWQLLGPVRIPMDEMVELDYEYVANWSLGSDLKIILRTIPHVLGRRGL